MVKIIAKILPKNISKKIIIFLCVVIIFVPVANVTAGDFVFYGLNNILFYDDEWSSSSCSSGGGIDMIEGHKIPESTGYTSMEAPIDEAGRFLNNTGNGQGKYVYHDNSSYNDLYTDDPSLAEVVHPGNFDPNWLLGLSQDYKDYYIAMRWDTSGDYGTWFNKAPRMVLVTNPSNGKSVYVTALEYGPSTGLGPDGKRVSGLSPAALLAISNDGDTSGDSVQDKVSLNYQWATDQKVKAGPINSTGGQCGNGIAAGDLVKTALGLALGSPIEEKPNMTDARDTYQTAVPKYNPKLISGVGDGGWSDCGGFVGTVMISSGVDPDYPSYGVALQYEYASKHADKYLIINNAQESNLKAGDILIGGSSQYGHTSIYTGDPEYPIVQASAGHQVPNVRNKGSLVWMMTQSSPMIIVRYIGK